MDLREAIERRRSIRKFRPDPVDDEALVAILDAMRAAPSAGNLQAYEVVVVRDEHTRGALAQAALGQPAVASAPVDVVVCQHGQRAATTYGRRGAELYAVQDASIAAAYAQLAATALGLGSVWIGAFYPEKVAELLQAPEGIVPVAIIALGHPAEAPEPTPRRALDDLVRWETF